MILLDENVDELQRRRLRAWRIHFKHIGTSIGRRGMKDVDEILPLLHSLRQPTFFTFDLGFYHPKFRHKNYCLVCLDVTLADGAEYIRRFLRHPRFKTRVERMGLVARVTSEGIRFWEPNNSVQTRMRW